MLTTFTVREDMTEELEVDECSLPKMLFDSLKQGILYAFRVDYIENRYHVTIAGDGSDEYHGLMVLFADGPEAAEHHIA